MANRRLGLRQKLLLLAGDLSLILLSAMLAIVLRFKQPLLTILEQGYFSVLACLMIYPVAFYIFDLYETPPDYRSHRFFGQILGAQLLVIIAMFSLFYVFPFYFGRGYFFICHLLIIMAVFLWRMIYQLVFSRAFKKRRILIVGAGQYISQIRSILKESQEYEIVGSIETGNSGASLNTSLKNLGTVDDLEKVVQEHKIDDIILEIDLTEKNQLNHTLVACRMSGITIYDTPTFYERISGKLPVHYIKDQWFVYIHGFNQIGDKIFNRFKRLMDIVISASLVLLFIPLEIVIALSIKLTSKGPILFKQERIGKNYQPFQLIKFRTMVDGAETDAPRWAEEDDPRVTFVGKILRRVRLDELPQFINVLRGDMSLIGPRPERDYFIKQIERKVPFYSLRFFAKPGLTGWAQINFRYGSSISDTLEKFQYDLYYIKNISLVLDMSILLKTIKIVFLGGGR